MLGWPDYHFVAADGAFNLHTANAGFTCSTVRFLAAVNIPNLSFNPDFARIN
jgi:hypothetical protein